MTKLLSQCLAIFLSKSVEINFPARYNCFVIWNERNGYHKGQEQQLSQATWSIILLPALPTGFAHLTASVNNSRQRDNPLPSQIYLRTHSELDLIDLSLN